MGDKVGLFYCPFDKLNKIKEPTNSRKNYLKYFICIQETGAALAAPVS